MLKRLQSFVTPSASPSSSRPASPPAEEDASAVPTGQERTAPLQPVVPAPSSAVLEQISGQLPLCGACDACDEDEEDDSFPTLPKGFDMDVEGDLLGTTKPMSRLAVLSTGKSNWKRDITDDTASLAFHLSNVSQKKRASPAGPLSDDPRDIEGIYSTEDHSKLSVLASSVSIDSSEEGKTTALVFPEFKLVTDIEISKEGAKELYVNVLDPNLGRAGAPSSSLKSWLLPYKAVILLCSHKTRDNRCAIAAPLLQSVLTQTLTLHGIDVDTTGESLEHLSAQDEFSASSPRPTEDDLAATLQQKSKQSSEVGIFNISHIGGHKYAGVMIICFPSGAIISYGRVTPKKCVAIVEETILKGRLIPEHLRGGGNLRRPEGKSLLDW